MYVQNAYTYNVTYVLDYIVLYHRDVSVEHTARHQMQMCSAYQALLCVRCNRMRLFNVMAFADGECKYHLINLFSNVKQ